MKKVIVIFSVISLLMIIFVFGLQSIRKNSQLNKSVNPMYDRLEKHYFDMDCNQFPDYTARPGSDISEPESNICAAERAWFENDPSFCRLHTDPDHCFGWMAIKLKNQKLCNEPGVETESCLNVVENTKNEDTWHWQDYINKNVNPYLNLYY